MLVLSAFAAVPLRARHLAVARVELTRERRRMKEHAWKLIPAALSNDSACHRYA